MFDKKLLSRTVIAGGILAVIGIGLFVGLWTWLGSVGADTFVRLVLSVCVPPAVMALLMGGFFLLVRKQPPQA